jgi:hypothetical protein
VVVVPGFEKGDALFGTRHPIAASFPGHLGPILPSFPTHRWCRAATLAISASADP